MKQEIIKLAEALAEKRSDISEILHKIADGEDWDESWVEHRFISAPIPEGAEKVMYDTLTTQFEFQTEQEWLIPGNEKYED